MEAKDPFDCAERGDVDYFKTVAPEILLQARDGYDYTVLTVAAKSNQLDCCEVIVERCTQLLYHQDNDDKWSLLHYAVVYSDNNLEITRFLITADSKADLEDGGGKIPNKRLLTMRDIYDKTALHLAVERMNHEAIKLLLEADPDFELLRMVDDQGRTCLHLAAEKGDHVSGELILKARPDNEFLKTTTASRSKKTALHFAVEKENLAIVQMLLEADHSNDLLAVVDSYQRTTLHYAVEQGNLDMVKLMCKAGLDKQLLVMPDHWKNTPLHFAIRSNNLEIVRLLIEGDVDIDYCANDYGNTPLVMAMDRAAVGGGSGSVSQDICKLLLEKDPSQCITHRGDGPIPLHLAASYGLFSVVKDIIQLHPDCINTVDFHGQHVLHIAAHHGHLDVIQLLLETKETDVVALLNTQDKDGNTPLHLAASNGNVQVVRLMLEAHPISAHIANISQQTPYMMAVGEILSDKYGECSKSDLELGGGAKIPNKKLLTMQNKYGKTALHSAVTKRNHEVTKLLLKADHDFELLPMVDNQGRTCLHLAAKYGDHVSAKLIIEARSDNEFLKMTTTLWKQTTLHIDVQENNPAVAELFT